VSTCYLLLSSYRSYSIEQIVFSQHFDNSVPVLLVTNTKVKHNLADSEYPLRVKQCADVVQAIRSVYPTVDSLRDATLEQLEAVKDKLCDVRYRRARHVITENQRTLAAAVALRSYKYEELGKLMFESHRSLKEDYEVMIQPM